MAMVPAEIWRYLTGSGHTAHPRAWPNRKQRASAPAMGYNTADPEMGHAVQILNAVLEEASAGIGTIITISWRKKYDFTLNI